MKKVMYLFMALCLYACTSNSITSRIESDVVAYKNCANQAAFKDWLFSIGSEGTTIVEDGITYGVFRTYDPTTSEVGLMIEIKDGVADYHRDDALDTLETQIEEALKNQGIVKSVYTDFGRVLVRMKNENNFTNAD
ncbi:MAG: hypothetical protein IIU71_05980 [Selenomonadaceae bacterium]|nr:hypothetical protein [Selenomonadaceae bacterium]